MNDWSLPTLQISNGLVELGTMLQVLIDLCRLDNVRSRTEFFLFNLNTFLYLFTLLLLQQKIIKLPK